MNHSRPTTIVRSVTISCALFLLTFLHVGCDGAKAAAEDHEPINIVATTGMIGDIARHVAGERAEVTVIMGSGTDPHLYRPTRRDMSTLLGADVVFYHGLNLEGRMGEALDRVRGAGRPVYAIAERISSEYLLDEEEEVGEGELPIPDPHLWMDPIRWAMVVDIVAEHLASLDPSGEEDFRANAATYRESLDALHAYAREAVASIPDDRRVLVTAHDAFAYFAERYDIEVLAIQGISTESEAGLRRIEEIVRTVVERQIPAVFTETSVPDRNVLALVEGAKARGHEVRIGGELFSDAMGEAGTYEGTYIGMIDHNVTTIVRALGGEAPERGFQNKLKE
ncbi:MAG: manganese transporter [Phycisphaerales bacterium]|nr:MAG: manganese transporter [Phycisphaerales bacterium]